MALHLIRSDNFSSVLSVLNDPETIFVIPIFQRPYAWSCLLYTSPSPRDRTRSRMPSSA